MLQQRLVMATGPLARHTEWLAVQMWYGHRPWAKELKYLIWRNKQVNQQQADRALVPDSYCQTANALLAGLPVPVSILEMSAPGC